MVTKLTVSLAQTSISQDPDGNLRTARRFLHQAATQGTDLIAFPEMFMALPQKGIPLTAVAEPIDGPFMSALSALAAEYGIAIVCGIWQTVEGHAKRAANVAVALGPDGTLLAHYNKIHLFEALSIRESDLMLRGNMPPPCSLSRECNLALQSATIYVFQSYSEIFIARGRRCDCSFSLVCRDNERRTLVDPVTGASH